MRPCHAKLQGLGFILSFLLWVAPASAANVVLVLLDDGSVRDTGSMRTLQGVAREGATFARAYTPTPICVPSRATVQTGLYRKRHGVFSNGYRPFVENGNLHRTFALGLRDGGVLTSLVGKYLNGAPASVPGWSSFVPREGGPYYYNYQLRISGARTTYDGRPADYSTDVFRDFALRQIRAALDARRPFFAMLNVDAPHNPWTPAPRHVGVPGLDDRQRSLLAVDDALRAIIDTLRAAGQLETTYVVLTSDHGLATGRPGGRVKGVPYEGAIRVPLVVRGPGVPAGATLYHMVNLADLAPTILEWMGAPAMDVDGRSFARLLRPSPPSLRDWRQAMTIAHTATPSAPGVPSWQGVRTTRYAYFRFEGGPTELYDMSVDPGQQTNLARTNPTLTTGLSRLSDALASCTGADCRRLEDQDLAF